ncbi:hypothetical protein EUX98_g258 [Antrodiella citrinella]|uniref:FAD-binding FR-type domain-containing protein n=1 Tax=Antrodiella citrinella TaxID=2447956 RepID=A0A4S4N5W6_9APHY|nr:hypothetical protein EUX98_g258 [Antrodiella citrinella]
MQARAAHSATTSLPANPTTPVYPNDLEWITAYLTIHSLSDASYVYAYFLWLVIALLLVTFSVIHGTGVRAGYLGAVWSRWSLRRRTWRKKHSLATAAKQGKPYRPPVALPSNAQILTLITIVIGSLCLNYIGPDYFAPGSFLWDVGLTPTAPVTKRSDGSSPLQPSYTIVKAWWTAAARTGQIAFALFPLCVLLALKAPPFALFSLSFLTNVHFDKLAWLHRWSGTGKIAYTYAWLYSKFLFGWIAYVLLTLIVIGSIPPIRTHHYETFYFLHILFVPSMLIMAGIHHPPVWWWCWAAIGLWIGERVYRLVWFLYNNGFFGIAQPALTVPTPTSNNSIQCPSRKNTKNAKASDLQSYPMHTLDLESPVDPGAHTFQYPTASSVGEAAAHSKCYTPPPGFVYAELLSGSTVRLKLVTAGYIVWAPGQHFLLNIPAICRFTSHPFTCASVCDEGSRSDSGREIVFYIRAKKGWTKRLRDTVTSLLAHGRKQPPGETLPLNAKLPEHGILMHAMVDGPFGSSAGTNWGAYSSVLIVAGGSGVSFGMSILEYMSLCLSGRDGRQLGSHSGGWGNPKFKTTRVRFVWLIREFSHIQWCASALRRCMSLVPPSELQVDIFVTNAKRMPHMVRELPLEEMADEELAPPEPQFVRDDSGSVKSRKSLDRQSMRSVTSTDSEESADSDVDLSYYAGDFVDEEHGDLGHEEHVLDYTNFDGDDDTTLPGEDLLNILAALVNESENVRLELVDTELADISVVAERVRPGKPKLERILADEVERSKGAVVVGCCGPTSLNAMMRKHVAALISPQRIRRGDMRGYIALVAEDFEY